jgi:hypothetical protein
MTRAWAPHPFEYQLSNRGPNQQLGHLHELGEQSTIGLPTATIVPQLDGELPEYFAEG